MINSVARRVSRVQMAVKSVEKEGENQIAKETVDFMDSGYDQKAVELFERYEKAAGLLMEALPDYIELLKMRENDFEAQHYDWWEWFRKNVYRKVIPTEMKDAWLALGALRESLAKVPADMTLKKNLLSKMREKEDEVETLREALQEPSEEEKEHTPKTPELESFPKFEEKKREELI
jgi:hypothetical protein